jgi:hypothetical protein
MRGGATDVNETQKWATSKNRLRTTDLGLLKLLASYSAEWEYDN